MAEDQNPVENVEIEPLSDDELEQVAGGALTDVDPGTSAGDSCCSCSRCSNDGAALG